MERERGGEGRKWREDDDVGLPAGKLGKGLYFGGRFNNWLRRSRPSFSRVSGWEGLCKGGARGGRPAMPVLLGWGPAGKSVDEFICLACELGSR